MSKKITTICCILALTNLSLRAQEPMDSLQADSLQNLSADIVHTEDTTSTIYIADTSYTADAMIMLAKKYIGVPYKYGAADPKGFDCSGFTQFIFSRFGYSLPHSSEAIGKCGRGLSTDEHLQKGDVVLYGGRKNTHSIGHVGIVVDYDSISGHFSFIHASVHSGVCISRSDEPYYHSRFIGARRILGNSLTDKHFDSAAIDSIATDRMTIIPDTVCPDTTLFAYLQFFLQVYPRKALFRRLL